jgi:hypothetical protein
MVDSLEVPKAEFDAVIKALLNTPPIPLGLYRASVS